LIKHNHPEIRVQNPDGKSLGYDEIFHASHRLLTNDEMELFKLIRGTTMTTLHDTNSKMKSWIEDHSEFVFDQQPNEPRVQLSKKLVELRAHLAAWLDKYAVWIPNDETRALVYLDDEKGHGPPFPENVEAAVDDVLRALGRGHRAPPSLAPH
jgi:hypothetical protein